jgi:hypothetical protein
VLEVDPKSGAVTWSYQGDEQHPFHSPLRSSAEVLPNDNVLITESDGGRMFEVTRAGRSCGTSSIRRAAARTTT